MKGVKNILSSLKKIRFKIKFNFYFMSFLTFIFVMDKSYTAIFGVLSAVLHELGHIIAIILKKGNITEIAFGIVNIDISSDSYTFSEAESEDELFILLSGPLINLIIALVLKFIYFSSGCSMANLVSYQNLFLGIVNLLPISSLDGGRILYILLSKKLDFILAEKIINIISILFLLPICILGFLVLIKSKYNFSLLILGCYLLSYVLFRNDNA